MTNNARTNTCAGQIGGNPGPNQLNVTAEQYDALVVTHLTELWSSYGKLDEIWYDGGFTASQKALLPPLMARLQPDAVAFQGENLCPNPSRWIGSESGYAPYPTWSTCDFDSYGAGDPDSPDWFPAETDFTVLAGDTWFFAQGVAVRPPAQLRAMFESATGHNTVTLIGIGIPPNGSLAGTQQAAALAQLGAYVRGCYGSPVAAIANVSGAAFTLTPAAPAIIDRVVIDEDQTEGHRIRGWRLDFLLANGTRVAADAGSAIGNRYISLAAAPGAVASATLTVLNATSEPVLRAFSLYAGCGDLARRLDGGLDASVEEG